MHQLAAARKRMPMVRVEHDYLFEGPDGRRSLPELFDGRSQLIPPSARGSTNADANQPQQAAVKGPCGRLSLGAAPRRRACNDSPTSWPSPSAPIDVLTRTAAPQLTAPLPAEATPLHRGSRVSTEGPAARHPISTG